VRASIAPSPFDAAQRRNALHHSRSRIATRYAHGCGVVQRAIVRARDFHACHITRTSALKTPAPRGHRRPIAHRTMLYDTVRACVIDARSTRDRRRAKSRMSCECLPRGHIFKIF
jgi:hypothetical protein